MTDSPFLYPEMRLSDALVRDLLRQNPWWQQKPAPLQPKTRRHLVGQIHRRLRAGLAPIVVIRGARQIGKTTAQFHLISDLLAAGVDPRRILRVQFDELDTIRDLPEPVLRLVDWFESAVLKSTLNETAHRGEPTYLLFDEVQNLDSWAPQLKSLVDNSTTQVVVTGSSALRIEAGRDSLAGRITTIEAGVLSLTEIAAFHGIPLGEPSLADNGLDALTQPQFWRDLVERGSDQIHSVEAAFGLFSSRGGYPLAHKSNVVDWPQIADQLNETVIRRVIQHDLRVGERGRKRDPGLLEELFRLACRYVGQAPPLNTLAREIQRALEGNVGTQRIRAYLRFLADTLLLRLIEPLEIRLKRRRGQPKICLVDHGLRASWLQEVIPLESARLAAEPHLSSIAGHLAESVVGATLCTINGLDVSHLPERDRQPEVDYVLTIGTLRIPLEVKYQRRVDPLRDTEGLRAFLERVENNAHFGILVTQTVDATVADPRIVTLPLSSLMLLR